MLRILSLSFFLLLSTAAAEARVFQSYSHIAKRAIPGVVNIRTTSYISGRDASLDPYSFFLKGDMPSSQSQNALGSGVIIDRKGHIVTNYHVIKNATKIEILFADSKRKVQAKLVGTDPQTDLALLKINVKFQLQPIDFGNSEKAKVGDVVLAIGNPFGFAHTVTSGIISAMGRVIGHGPFDNFLQTDASIHPGNSGGPLIDMRSRVIGINTAVSTKGAGIGFALPSNLAKKVIADLKKHGKVIRPFLGVVGKNILSRDELDTSYNPRGVYGVLVTNLIVDGPAHRGRMKMGDLIMGINDKKVYDIHYLQKVLSNRKPKDRIRVKLYRKGKGTIYVNLELEEIPSSSELPTEKDLF